MVMYRYGRFDDLIGQPGVHYVPPSRPPEPDLNLPFLTVSDTPDDFVVLEDVVICRFGGLAWRDLWLSASVQYMPGEWRDAYWLPGKMTPDGAGINLHPDCINVTVTIEEPVLMIDSGVGAYNFGHSIHDSMPYGLLFQRSRALIPGLRPLTAPFKFEKQRQIFSIVFDYPYQKWDLSHEVVRLKKLVLARRQSIMNDSDGQPHDRWSLPFAGLRHIRNSVYAAMNVSDEPGLPPGAGSLSLFLHRFNNSDERQQSGLLQGRNFTNHCELLEALMARSFLVFEPGWMNLEQIVPLLANAGVAVGVHGAQCANLVFCRPGTKVFEIRGHTGNWRSIEALSAVLGHQFVALQHSAPSDAGAPAFDVDKIVAAVTG